MDGHCHGRGDMNLPMDPLSVAEMGTPWLCRVSLVPLRVGYGTGYVKMVICTVNLLLSAL